MRHKQKHVSGGGGGGVQLSLIVTPMLDMAFQLMAFFIMTYHPSALEAHIDGNLLPPSLIATSGPKAPNAPSELPPVDDEPPLQDVLLVVVKSVPKGQAIAGRSDGQPSQILLKRPEAADRITIADTDMTIDEGLKKLTAELKKSADEPGATKANIKIEGDGDLKHRHLMQVYDACKMAGYQNISFVAPARTAGGS